MLALIDSPLTFGLSTVTNQLKFEATLALRMALRGEPLQISIVAGTES